MERGIETGLKSRLNVAVLSRAPPHARKYIPLLEKSSSFRGSPTFADVVLRNTAASCVQGDCRILCRGYFSTILITN